MRRLSKFFLMLITLMSLSLTPTSALASPGRTASLSLNPEDYWILPDSANLFANPAYATLYPQFVEFTAGSLDADGNPAPYGALLAKLDPKLTVGLILGYPQASFYNRYATGTPGDTFADFTSQVDLPPPAGEIHSDNLRFLFGYDFDSWKFGVSASYTGLKSRDVTENAPPGVTEIRTSSHQDLRINLGILSGDMSFTAGAEYPSLFRQYSLTNETAGATDIREADCSGASVYKLGFVKNFTTSQDNQLILSLNYSAANFPCLASEYRDTNGDGILEEGTQDQLMAQRYLIQFGLADRLLISEKGMVFAAAYGHIYKFKQYANGYNADGSLYDSSIKKSNEFTVPIIVGGEVALAPWMTLRISGRKNIISFTKWYDETTGRTLTDYTSSESPAAINAGVGIHINTVSIDLSFITPSGNNGEPTTNGHDAPYSTLSISWRF